MVALEATKEKKSSLVFFNLSQESEGSSRTFSGMPWMTIQDVSDKGKNFILIYSFGFIFVFIMSYFYNYFCYF